MKKILRISVCGFLITISANFAKATQTLDCFTNENLIIRIRVNSSAQIADLQIRTSENIVYAISFDEFELKQFGWEVNGFGDEGNFIHVITREAKSGFPAFELNVRESTGSIQIRGENKPCKCEWGYE